MHTVHMHIKIQYMHIAQYPICRRKIRVSLSESVRIEWVDDI